jgi:hypothetical protein
MVAFCLGALGCTDNVSPQSKGRNASKNVESDLDTALVKISAIAAMYKLEIATNRTVSCVISDALGKKATVSASKQSQQKDELAEKIIAQMISKNSSECEFFKKVVTETDVAFEKIKADGKLPRETWLFSIFGSPDTNDRYEKTDIGLFLSIASCEQIEALAKQTDFGTQRCRRWQWPETGVPDS